MSDCTGVSCIPTHSFFWLLGRKIVTNARERKSEISLSISILVYSKTEQEHWQHLREVLDILREHKLSVSPKKCEFWRSAVEFVGHVISANGLSVQDAKIKAIKSWMPPTNMKQLQSFLGLASYYRKFIDHFADIAQPLNRLLKKNTPYQWTSLQQEAFERLRFLIMLYLSQFIPTLRNTLLAQCSARTMETVYNRLPFYHKLYSHPNSTTQRMRKSFPLSRALCDTHFASGPASSAPRRAHREGTTSC